MRSPRPARSLACLTTTAFVMLGAALPLHADDREVHYAEPTERPGFFRQVGEFFHDLFATEQSLSPRPTPPRPSAPRYNLDLPPPGAGYTRDREYASHSSYPSTETEKSSIRHGASTTTSAVSKSKPVKHSDSTVAVTETTTHKSTADSTPEPAPKKKHTEDKIVSTTTTTETVKTTSTPKPAETKNVPTGTRTSKTTRVKSPYPPYNELDVTGLNSGSLAMDPTTQKVFRVP